MVNQVECVAVAVRAAWLIAYVDGRYVVADLCHRFVLTLCVWYNILIFG